MLMNAEYRWEVNTGLDMALFADAGKVFRRHANLNFKDLESAAASDSGSRAAIQYSCVGMLLSVTRAFRYGSNSEMYSDGGRGRRLARRRYKLSRPQVLP
jgi:hypothetical protein